MQHVSDIRIADNGRMVLPKAARAALGVTGAGVLALTVDGNEVKLTSMASRVKHAQALYRQHAKGDYTVDDFLKDRREDSAREEEGGR